jgi:hypothetical protein
LTVEGKKITKNGPIHILRVNMNAILKFTDQGIELPGSPATGVSDSGHQGVERDHQGVEQRHQGARHTGEIGRTFAEVHHLNPLSERPASEWTEAVLTKIADVAVLCANCHRMIHRRRPALSLDELRSFMRTESR